MERSQTNKAWFVSTQILPLALPQPPGSALGLSRGKELGAQGAAPVPERRALGGKQHGVLIPE